jgi:hypothetical protein
MELEQDVNDPVFALGMDLGSRFVFGVMNLVTQI